MANRYAVKAGNWSDPSVWDGGTLPGPGDDVRPNNFTVDIDQDIEVASLVNVALAPAASGGWFRVAGILGTRTINANIDSRTVRVLEVTAQSGSLIINGWVSGGTSSSSFGMTVPVGGSTDITINGDLYGTTGSSGHGAVISAGYTGNFTVNGNVYSGTSSGVGLSYAATGPLTINGNVFTTGTSSGGGLTISASSAVNIYGNVSAGAGTGTGVSNSGASATIYISGDVISTNGGFGVTSSGTASLVKVGGNLKNGPNGRNAIYAIFFVLESGKQTTWEMSDDALPPPNGNPVILTNTPGGGPSPEDVRAGTLYGADNSLTGTLAVPPVESVASGVPVDNTVGTAALNIADVAAVTGAQIAAAVSS